MNGAATAAGANVEVSRFGAWVAITCGQAFCCWYVGDRRTVVAAGGASVVISRFAAAAAAPIATYLGTTQKQDPKNGATGGSERWFISSRGCRPRRKILGSMDLVHSFHCQTYANNRVCTRATNSVKHQRVRRYRSVDG